MDIMTAPATDDTIIVIIIKGQRRELPAKSLQQVEGSQWPRLSKVAFMDNTLRRVNHRS